MPDDSAVQFDSEPKDGTAPPAEDDPAKALEKALQDDKK